MPKRQIASRQRRRLAQQLGISRVKLRDILSVLQSNGYISRKRGIVP